MAVGTESVAPSGTPLDARALKADAIGRVDGFIKRERFFLLVLAAGFIGSAVAFPHPEVARWMGFLFAGYAAIGNDSIQTIGTFLASNRHRRWWVLWLFVGGLFLFTVTYSFIAYDGDVSYGRLASKGFDQTPMSFSYLQVAAPLFLLILTRLRMPVSTTFMLLTSFSVSTEGVTDVLSKSMSGYFVAFGVAIGVWLLVSRLLDRTISRGKASPYWYIVQWLSTGFLWSVWLMQDAANIAVYLPRSMSVVEFIAFAGIIFLGLGLLFKKGGERVQQVVEEKSHVVDVRAATLIDFIYGGILYFFKVVSPVPMSTTWVFIGLLAGRELGMALTRTGTRGFVGSLKVMGKDFGYVTIGLVLSLILAFAVNDTLREEILGAIGL